MNLLSRCVRVFNKIRYYSLFPGINSIRVGKEKECVILGNGPSLLETISMGDDFFKGKKVLCVNDFAHSEYLELVKPDYYVFFDPVYWARDNSQFNHDACEKTRLRLAGISWEAMIFLPAIAKSWNYFSNLPFENKNIKIFYVNKISLPDKLPFKNFFYKMNFAMPCLQNVLVGAVFICLNVGFKKLYIVGADHSWHENIIVGDDNVLYWKFDHFYGKSELRPIYKDTEEKEIFKMHELLFALARMFAGYHELEEYAKYLGAKIYNASAKSYIDAFERFDINTKMPKR